MAAFETGQVVAIVDGEFGQNLSVACRKIIDAIGRGVRLYGAANMGALRAAELRHLGMRGFG
jgi:hypothetical protein